ncbi:TPR repeat protein [Penicillium atrosanguineum]|nr:TPR repeat protein [Penicillium atrosanguineum]
MSGLEVIGGVSAVISILDTSIRLYNSAQHDFKLSATFKAVGRRLPVLRHTLETCKSHLELRKDTIPQDVSEALEKILDNCETNSSNLKSIFERIVPCESNTWEQRYSRLLRRLGKGNKVEELMASINEDVQLIVNYDAVLSGKTPNAPHFEDFSFRGPIGCCLGQAPYLASEHFVGRSRELYEIARILQPLHTFQKQQRLFLGGMGGIGKTELAIAYAKSHGGSYDSVLWLNAQSEAALKDSLRFIASLIFSVQDPGVLERSAIPGRVYRWLSDSRNTRWLLIFDKYDDPSQFEISDYFPSASHGAIIVTTRALDLAGNTLHIKPLSKVADSLRILQIWSKEDNVQSDLSAKRLAEQLGGFPLALAAAGTYVQLTGSTFERYLQEYEALWNIDPNRRALLQEYRENTPYTTWDLSYAHLKTEDSDAVKLLSVLAYFDNQNVWYELFYAGVREGSPKWLHNVVTSNVSFCGAIDVLTQYFFLEVDSLSGSWHMHKYVHDWTLATLNKNIDRSYYWYAVDCVNACIAGVEEHSLGDFSFSRIARHAVRLAEQRFLENYTISDATPGQLDKIARISLLLRHQMQFDKAEQIYTHALARYEKVLGPDHLSTLATVHSIGCLYRAQGKPNKAEQMFLRALAGREKALGRADTSTLTTVTNLGILYRGQSKLHKAEQVFVRALAGRQKALGPDHILTLTTLSDLGILYREQGKLNKAERIFIRALNGKEKVLGLGHASTLATLNHIGILYRDQGIPNKAELMFMRALEGREKVLGPDHSLTTATINHLGILYRGQGKLNEAEQMFLRALAGYEKALGPDHRLTFQAVNKLQMLYIDQGKLDKAEQMKMRAL